MRRVFHIDESKKGARELLTYLRSLDFVEEEDLLTTEQYDELNQRRKKYISGKTKTYSLEEVTSFILKAKK